MCASINTSLGVGMAQTTELVTSQWNLLPSTYRSTYMKQQPQQTRVGLPKEAIHWSSSDPSLKYVFVNSKQYQRVIKRRKEREQFISQSGGLPEVVKKQKFKYESRHRHAMNRQRGEGGRFCGKKKVEQSQLSNINSPQQETTVLVSDNSPISPISSVQLNPIVGQSSIISFDTVPYQFN